MKQLAVALLLLFACRAPAPPKFYFLVSFMFPFDVPAYNTGYGGSWSVNPHDVRPLTAKQAHSIVECLYAEGWPGCVEVMPMSRLGREIHSRNLYGAYQCGTLRDYSIRGWQHGPGGTFVELQVAGESLTMWVRPNQEDVERIAARDAELARAEQAGRVTWIRAP